MDKLLVFKKEDHYTIGKGTDRFRSRRSAQGVMLCKKNSKARDGRREIYRERERCTHFWGAIGLFITVTLMQIRYRERNL